MNLSIKHLSLVIGLMIVTLVCAETFIIKKTKEVIVPYKDQATASIFELLMWLSRATTDHGTMLTSMGKLQEEMMKIAKDEIEGKSDKLGMRSSAELKQLRDATQKIHNRLKRVHEEMNQVSQELNQYIRLLEGNAEQLKSVSA